MKHISLIAAMFVFSFFAWSSPTVEKGAFEITYPEDKDTFTAFGEIANSNGQELLIEFEGAIGPDARQIRAIWKSGDGKRGDDFVLKKFKPGDASFVYRASRKLLNLNYGSNQYRLIATFQDGSTKEASLTLYVIHGHLGERAKPVIYLYPTSEREVSVAVRPQGGVTVSIPEMGAAWKVKARPDGSLMDLSSGKEYHYLFWESKDYGPPVDRSEGFVVARDELEPWLEGKLGLLGLEPQEIRDFEDYWLPVLSRKPFLFIRFHQRERIDREAPLDVYPAPDSTIRVYFEYEALDAPIEVREQLLEPARRSGFSLVEWGGRRF